MNSMTQTLFIIVILCFINISTISSFNINNRLFTIIGHEQSEAMINKSTTPSYISSSTDRCIPVRAVKELGCILHERNVLLEGLFKPVCERHQLCYACGFAHSITVRQCNKIASRNMYHLCSQDKSLSSSECIQQRFTALNLLQKHTYRPETINFGFYLECHQECVLNYLHAN